MANRLDQAIALVQDATIKLSHLKGEYEKSLLEKHVRVELQIAIKGVLDNLRSALDYVAYELYDRFGTPTASTKVYFPIAGKGAKRDDFRSLVGRNIPGLLNNRADLVDLLATFQEFSATENHWLPDFASLANENKHANLTPQTRTEVEQLTVKSPGLSVSWYPSMVKFGPGVVVAGAPINPGTQLPVPGPSHTVTRQIWVDFKFASIGQSVLPFLERCIDGTEKILQQIRTNT